MDKKIRVLVTTAASFVAFFAVREAFAAFELLNTATLMRPTDGLGPVLGLLLGWPAVAGCGLAWATCEVMAGAALPEAAASTAAELVCLAFPLVVWRVAAHLRPGLGKTPRLKTMWSVLLFFAVIYANSHVSAACLSWMGPHEAAGATAEELVQLETFAFEFLFGVPCLLALGRRVESWARSAGAVVAPATPGAPAGSSRQPDLRTRTNLSEFVVAAFMAATMVFAVVFYVITYGPYIVEGDLGGGAGTAADAEWGLFITTAYVMLGQFVVSGLAVMLVAVGLFGRRVTRPVELLTRSAADFMDQLQEREVTGRALTADPVDVAALRPPVEVAQLVDQVNGMRADLVDYVGRLEAATAERERGKAELDIAREIQLSAVPHSFASQEALGLKVAGFMRPAREVGGDFYDVFDIDADRCALVVGDVSGKGVPASLFMMRSQGLIRSCVLASPNDLGAALAAANNAICERNDAMLFVTAFVCVFDRATGTLSFANAGHNPPSVRRAGVRSYLDVTPGLVLGAMEGMPYAQGQIALFAQDEVCVYTDGVTEAADPASELFGEKRLAETLARCDERGLAVAGLPEAVTAGIDAFAASAPQADDITILCARWDLPVAQVEVPSEQTRLDELFSLVDEVCAPLEQQCLATERMAFDLRLIVEELFVNVCRYGRGDKPSVPVRLSLAADPGARRLYLRFSDAGVAFDPLGHQTVMPAVDRPVGGLGIHLVRKLTASQAYERVCDQNTLWLVKEFV